MSNQESKKFRDMLQDIFRKLNSLAERCQSLEVGYRFLSLSDVHVGTNYVMISSDVYIGITSTGTIRAVTLVNANTCVSGRIVVVKDEGGGAAAFNITVTPAAGTIDGAANKVINTNYGVLRFISNGTNWFTW